MSTPDPTPAPVPVVSIPAPAKRLTEENGGPNAKRRKNEGPSTPGLMGPPGSLQKKKDDGLDEGDPNDMFGSAGINLQDEERNMSNFEVPRRVQSLATSGLSGHFGSRPDGESLKQSDFLDSPALRYFINQKLSSHGLTKMDPEIHGLLGLALKERLTGLLTRMVVLAKHRMAPPPVNGRPIDDVGRALRAISLREIQEEDKRRSAALIKRQELEAKRREEESNSKRKDGMAGPGKGSKGLSDTAIARNANATAQLMLNTSGGKQYSWMTSASSSSLSQSLPRRQLNSNSPAGNSAAGKAGGGVFKAGSVEEIGVIGMKDFIGALELDGEDVFGRGGRTLCRAYTLLKD